jgi:maleate isomerase
MIVPSVNVRAETEMAAMAPAGVSLHTTRLKLATARSEDVRAMSEQALGAAELLADVEPDFVLFNCTAAAALAAPGLADRIAEVAGCPAGTTAEALIDAARSLGVSRLALVSPYPSRLAELEERFLREHELDVLTNLTLDSADARSWPRIEPERWMELALSALAESGAEAVVLSCTNIRALEIVDALEAQAGVPVLCSNQAAFWSALVAVGVPDAVPGCGALLSGRSSGPGTLEASAA